MYSRSLAHKFRKEYRQIEIDKFIRAEIYILIDSFLEQNICFRGSNVAWLGAFPASYMPLFMFPPPRRRFLSVFIPVSRQPPPMCTTYPFVREISISLYRYRHAEPARWSCTGDRKMCPWKIPEAGSPRCRAAWWMTTRTMEPRKSGSAWSR